MSKIDEAIQRFDEAVRDIGGCADRYCYVTGKRTGMVTNGGCRCWQDRMTAQRAMRAARRLRDDLEAAASSTERE